VHVVRCFENDDVMHPLKSVDPVRDCKSLEEEFQIADLVIIENRIERMEKENKKGLELDTLKKCRDHIENGAPLRTLPLPEQEDKLITGYTFLSRKPLLLLGNYGEESIGEDDPSGLTTYAEQTGQTLVALCGAMEMEVAQLPPEERTTFREELGLGEESKTLFLQSAYSMLGLISFLTAGEPEVRAWTIKKTRRRSTRRA
jgi:ribosome-binding ATPase